MSLLRTTVMYCLNTLHGLGRRLYRLDDIGDGPGFPLGYEAKATRPLN